MAWGWTRSQCLSLRWHLRLRFYIYNQSDNSTIVQIIFHFLWDHWAECGIFENGVQLMYTLEGVSNVENFITAYEAYEESK